MQSRLRLLVAEKEMREQRRISLRKFAEESGAPISTIHRLMNNTIKRIPLDELGAICRYLDCDVGDLLYMAEQPGEPRAAHMQSGR